MNDVVHGLVIDYQRHRKNRENIYLHHNKKTHPGNMTSQKMLMARLFTKVKNKTISDDFQKVTMIWHHHCLQRQEVHWLVHHWVLYHHARQCNKNQYRIVVVKLALL